MYTQAIQGSYKANWHIEMQKNMFGDILCTFPVRELLLENLSESDFCCIWRKKCRFSRIFMRHDKVYDGIVVR